METKTQTAINSAGFTAEQQKYLEGFFAGAVQRGPIPFVGHTTSGRITSDSSSGLLNQAAGPSEETYFGTPVSDLCKEERWKHEENPLDIWDKLIDHANGNKTPAPDDLFRFKFHGLFYVSPAQDSFMLRLRVPGAVLSAYQLRGIAEIAADWGSGRTDITTRSNLQIREFKPRDIVRVLNKVRALGMSSRGSGADNIRNITASPISGIDPAELYDVSRARRSNEQLHPQLARPLRPPPQIQYRLRQWRLHQRCCRYQRHRLRRRARSKKVKAFPPASTSGSFFAASPDTNSSPPTAAFSFARTRPLQWRPQ